MVKKHSCLRFSSLHFTRLKSIVFLKVSNLMEFLLESNTFQFDFFYSNSSVFVQLIVLMKYFLRSEKSTIILDEMPPDQ